MVQILTQVFKYSYYEHQAVHYHYKVYKADDELETYSNIVLLDRESRIEELAKMLSGAAMTQAAMENAKVLLAR